MTTSLEAKEYFFMASSPEGTLLSPQGREAGP